MRIPILEKRKKKRFKVRCKSDFLLFFGPFCKGKKFLKILPTKFLGCLKRDQLFLVWNPCHKMVIFFSKKLAQHLEALKKQNNFWLLNLRNRLSFFKKKYSPRVFKAYVVFLCRRPLSGCVLYIAHWESQC